MKKMILFITILFYPLLLFAQDNDGMSAYYMFLGNTNDATGNVASAVANGPGLTEDRFGFPDGAYNFDGSNDYILVPDTQYVDIPDDFSLGFWIKPTGNPAANYVLLNKHLASDNYDGSWWIGITPDLKVTFEGSYFFDYNMIMSKSTVPLDVWTHLFFTFDDSTDEWTIYLNGIVDSTSTLSLELENTNKDLYIGARSGLAGFDNYYQGAIDEIRIYQRALSTTEVADLYDASPQISVDPDTTQYGNVRLDQGVPAPVTIKNTGNAELRVSSIQITGTDSAVFEADTTGFTILPADSQLIQVDFFPNAIRDFTATLKIYSNTADTTVVLAGTGIFPVLSLPATELNFGAVDINEIATDSFVVKNTGNAELEVSLLQITGDDNNVFGATTTEFFVQPGDSHFVQVNFTPNAMGDFNAVLNIFSDAADTTVALIGTGQSPVLALSQTNLDFGTVGVNEFSTDSLAVKNTGNAELLVSSLKITGNDSTVFSVDTTGFTILPEDSHFVKVNFAPITSGNFSAVLNIYSNAADTTVALSGAASAPVIYLSSDTLDLGSVEVNDTKSAHLTVKNVGQDTLILYNIETADNNMSGLGMSFPSPSPRLGSGDSLIFEIDFEPTITGYQSTYLLIFSNDPGSPDSVFMFGEATETFAINVEPDTTPVAGDTLNLSVTAPPNFRPEIRRLYYRQPGETSWHSVVLDSTETDYNAMIPPDSVTYKGIEYYVYFSDGQNEVTYPATNPQSQPASLQVNVEEVSAEIELRPGIYKMFSAPLLPMNTNLFSMLFDNYGEYDIKHWRLLQWSDQDSAYREFPDFQANLTPGTAFWLITRTGATFDLENCLSMDLSQPFIFRLNPGWNQIGNPFPFPVATDSVIAPDEIEPPVYYDGNDYQYNIPVLNPWEGYFVYNLFTDQITVEILPIPAPTGLPKKTLTENINLEEEYYIQISGKMKNTLLVDENNFVGLLKTSPVGCEKADISEAPPIGDFVRLSVIEEKHRYAAKFKPVNQEGQCWDMTIDATIPQRKIQMSVTEFGTLPENFKLHILDEDYQCPIQINQGTFTITMGDSGTTRQLKIIIGTDEYAKNNNNGISLIPITNVLYQNYPNPFNPETTIRYQIGQRGQVTLEIYNMLGQKIRTLVHKSQSPGQHQIHWNGANDAGNSVASGIYIYSLKTSEFTHTRKLVLIR